MIDMNEVLIETKDLRKSFGDLQVLKGISEVIRKGEVARIAPLPLGDLTWARGASEVGGQRVVVAWRIIDGDFCIDVDLPEDYSGRVPVYVPWKEEPVGYATGGHTQLVV